MLKKKYSMGPHCLNQLFSIFHCPWSFFVIQLTIFKFYWKSYWAQLFPNSSKTDYNCQSEDLLSQKQNSFNSSMQFWLTFLSTICIFHQQLWSKHNSKRRRWSTSVDAFSSNVSSCIFQKLSCLLKRHQIMIKMLILPNTKLLLSLKTALTKLKSVI